MSKKKLKKQIKALTEELEAAREEIADLDASNNDMRHTIEEYECGETPPELEGMWESVRVPTDEEEAKEFKKYSAAHNEIRTTLSTIKEMFERNEETGTQCFANGNSHLYCENRGDDYMQHLSLFDSDLPCLPTNKFWKNWRVLNPIAGIPNINMILTQMAYNGYALWVRFRINSNTDSGDDIIIKLKPTLNAYTAVENLGKMAMDIKYILSTYFDKQLPQIDNDCDYKASREDDIHNRIVRIVYAIIGYFGYLTDYATVKPSEESYLNGVKDLIDEYRKKYDKAFKALSIVSKYEGFEHEVLRGFLQMPISLLNVYSRGDRGGTLPQWMNIVDFFVMDEDGNIIMREDVPAVYNESVCMGEDEISLLKLDDDFKEWITTYPTVDEFRNSPHPDKHVEKPINPSNGSVKKSNTRKPKM